MGRFVFRSRRRIAALLALSAVAVGVGVLAVLFFTGGDERARDSQGGARDGLPSAQAPAADVPVVLVLGDSLTAGRGLPIEQSFPSLIQERLREGGYPHRVVNAGVSGDTSAGGLARLDWLLRQRVDVMVLELGANDGLRGTDPRAMRANLAKIIERSQAQGILVVLAGMRMPGNYGPAYSLAYSEVFPELAGRYGLPLIPFLLEGVGMRPELNQMDGIHPNEEGTRIVADTVWGVLEPVLERSAVQ